MNKNKEYAIWVRIPFQATKEVYNHLRKEMLNFLDLKENYSQDRMEAERRSGWLSFPIYATEAPTNEDLLNFIEQYKSCLTIHELASIMPRTINECAAKIAKTINDSEVENIIEISFDEFKKPNFNQIKQPNNNKSSYKI